jgi:hypothetical protein
MHSAAGTNIAIISSLIKAGEYTWPVHAQDLALQGMPRRFVPEIDRPGGVYFYAAKGENEVAIRLQASLENRYSDIAERGKSIICVADAG